MVNSIVLERLPTAGAGLASARAVPRRQRVYIFLTRHGLVFSMILVAMLIGAVNYNNSLAYALTFLLSSLVMVAMLHTYGNLRGLVISSLPPEPVFAGQVAAFPLLFDNSTGKRRLALQVQLQALKKKHWWQKKPALAESTVVNLAAKSTAAPRIRIAAEKRGYLVPGRLKLASTWPLGLFRAWSYMSLGERCLVYPRPAGSNTLPPMTLLEDDEHSGKGSGTEDFIGFRQYQSGDSMRSIDWKAYARHTGLVSKRFSGRGTRKILLHWQDTAHLANTELRLSQLCLWILQANELQAQYSLVLPGGSEFDFGAGEQHRHRCLAALAIHGLDTDQS